MFSIWRWCCILTSPIGSCACTPSTLNPHHTTQHHLTFLKLLVTRHDACNVTLVSRRRALPRQRMSLCRLSQREKAPDSRERCVGLQSNRIPFCSEPKSWYWQSGKVTVLQWVNARRQHLFGKMQSLPPKVMHDMTCMTDFCTELEEPYVRLWERNRAEPPPSPLLFSLSPGLKPPCLPANNVPLKSPDSKRFYHVKIWLLN